MYFEQWNQLGIEQTQLNVRSPPLWAKAQTPHPKTKNHSHSDTNDPKMKRNRYVYTQGQQDSQNQTWPLQSLQPSSLQAKCEGVAELQRREVADDKSKWNNLEEL